MCRIHQNFLLERRVDHVLRIVVADDLRGVRLARSLHLGRGKCYPEEAES